METYYRVAAFLVGLTVGSFLNVVIARLPEGESVVRPRSRCPQCRAPIAAWDNIPVLSWLILRGRCRHCKTPISPRYPTVELLVGFLALAVYSDHGRHLVSLFLFAFVCLLVAITYIDLDKWTIPLELTVTGIVLGVVNAIVNPAFVSWRDSLIGGVAGFGAFALLALIASYVFKKEALGEGDWWLLAMIGTFLGWQALLPVVLLASLQGSVVGLLLIALGRAEKGRTSPAPAAVTVGASPGAPATGSSEVESAAPSEQKDSKAPADDEDDWVPPPNSVPFGPFLSLGALEQLFLGDWLRLKYDEILHRLIS
jgi:leader peptidase (prepilin peptidase)/N-methyltransferase